MSRIYWDTMLFVYWMEENPKFSARVAQIRQRMREREDELCTSALTLGEVLTGPIRQGAVAGVERVRQLFQLSWIKVLPFTADTAIHYANVRANFKVSPADAMHLACAAEAKADLFLTNDSRLVGKHVPGIGFIAGLHTDVF